MMPWGKDVSALRAWLDQPVSVEHSDQLRLVARLNWDTKMVRIRRAVGYYGIYFYPTLVYGDHIVFLITNVLLVLAPIYGMTVARDIRRSDRVLRQRDRLVIYIAILIVNAIFMCMALAFATSGSKPIAMIAMITSAGMMLEMCVQMATERYIHIISTSLAAITNITCGILVGITPARDWTATELGFSIPFALMACVYIGMMTLSVRKVQDELSRAHAEVKARVRELAHVNSHDGLTGLANRGELDRCLAAALRAEGREESRVAYLLIDLDGFKPINDTYGHAAGDAVLKATADRLVGILRENAVPARIGGDEFAVLLTDVTSHDAACSVATRILAEIPKRIPWGNAQLSVGASIGIALQADIGCGPTELMAAADQAMYLAKAIAGPAYVLHEPVAEPAGATADDRALIEQALQLHQFVPHYQPKIDLQTGSIAGFECLARWYHPDRGLLGPADFLPQVAELQLFTDFSFGMIRKVLTQIAAWRDAGLDPGRVSVNLNEATLSTESAIEDVEWLLAEHPGLACHLSIEVTESVIVSRSAGVIRANVERLARLGVHIGLDDFGTGHAAFRHVRQFPFDEIKVDGSFMLELGNGPRSCAVVESFVTLARGLGADVVAEGVETPEQAAILRKLGCRYAQGYLFGEAVAAAEATARLARGGPGTLAGKTA